MTTATTAHRRRCLLCLVDEDEFDDVTKNYCGEDCEMAVKTAELAGQYIGASASASSALERGMLTMHFRLLGGGGVDLMGSQAPLPSLLGSLTEGLCALVPHVVPTYRTCWHCAAVETTWYRMRPCPLCFSAHYCSEECELADRFGAHGLVCGTDLGAIVYRASSGLAGLVRIAGLHSRMDHMDEVMEQSRKGCGGARRMLTSDKSVGACFHAYKIVAKTDFRPGAVILRAPVLSGFSGDLACIYAMEHFLPETGMMAHVLGPESVSSWPLLPSCATAENLLRNMIVHEHVRFGLPLTLRRSDCVHMRHVATLKPFVSDRTLSILMEMVQWIMIEREFYEAFLSQCEGTVSREALDLVRSGLDTFVMLKPLGFFMTLRRSRSGTLIRGGPDAWMQAHLRAALAVDGKVADLRLGLSKDVKMVLRVSMAFLSISPWLKIREMGVVAETFRPIQHTATMEELDSLSFAHAFYSHSCTPLAQVCTTDILEGHVNLKDHGLHKLGFPDTVFSTEEGALLSVSTCYAHQPISAGAAITINYTELHMVSWRQEMCEKVLANIVAWDPLGLFAFSCTCASPAGEQYKHWIIRCLQNALMHPLSKCDHRDKAKTAIEGIDISASRATCCHRLAVRLTAILAVLASMHFDYPLDVVGDRVFAPFYCMFVEKLRTMRGPAMLEFYHESSK